MDVIKTIELLKNAAKGTLIGGMSLLALSVFFFFYFGISRDLKERKKMKAASKGKIDPDVLNRYTMAGINRKKPKRKKKKLSEDYIPVPEREKGLMDFAGTDTSGDIERPARNEAWQIPEESTGNLSDKDDQNMTRPLIRKQNLSQDDSKETALLYRNSPMAQERLEETAEKGDTLKKPLTRAPDHTADQDDDLETRLLNRQEEEGPITESMFTEE